MEGAPNQEVNPVLKGEVLSWVSQLEDVVAGELDSVKLARLSVDIEELVKKYKS